MKKLTLLILSAIIAFLLTGCELVPFISDILEDETMTQKTLITATMTDDEKTSYPASATESNKKTTTSISTKSTSKENTTSKDTASLRPTTTTDKEKDYRTLTYYDIANFGYYGWYYMESTGTKKILVIPVQYEPTKSLVTEDALEDLNTAFFGTSEEMDYESVSSYYEKSSYGKLKIEGTVAPVTKGFSKYDLRNDETKVIEYTDSFLKTSGIDPKDYDSDKDGYIDFIAYIYFAPYYTYGSNVPDYFWAHTYSAELESDVDRPKVNNYMFASYEFMYYDGYELDAHTYIHETGHGLGLDDYYDSTEDSCDPVGETIMMSSTVNDLDAFSKLALGWMDNVYVADGNTTITLHSIEDVGECIIIGNNYNGNAFSEYLIIEYYTPTNLNEWSVTNDYDGLKGLSRSGVRIYYIDARIASCDQSDNLTVLKNSSYFNDNGKNILTTPMASNTPDYSLYYEYGSRRQPSTVNYKLITLIDKSGISHTSKNYTQNENSLFYSGDTFDTTTVKFNSSEKVSYILTFLNQTDGSIDVSIVKK